MLLGWLLMIPPVHQERPGNFQVDETAPIADWKQWRAYGSAEKCEDMATSLRLGREESKRGCLLTAPKDGNEDAWCTTGAEAFAQARCVPAEYVYPPKQP